MTISTKTSKSELRKKPSKAKQIDLIPEKPSKKIKASSSAKPMPSKKVKNQPKETEVEKIQKKARSSDATSTNKKTSLKKVNFSTELQHKSSSPSLPTKNATKKSKQTSNATVITTFNATKTVTNVKKREKTSSGKQAIKSTVEKKSSTKKLKKQSSAHTLPPPPFPPPSTPIPMKRPPLKHCVSVATSTSIGVDMSTQTDPIIETQLSKPAYQSHYLDVRDLVPVNALKITLEELMSSMQIVEKQRVAIPIKKQATIKSKLRKALKSIKI
ncbi:hypothetical protein MAM1_0040c02862 [Mucor ambiguus]|uniref:Uncharacterized protein n=1 Tax=Mucor ambiguus TaxID=91626 RepID=A0A0C9M8F7_9FUNG|nr:hypothetical protein MAM1_0040c02862 [Mucor ambiguus]